MWWRSTSTSPKGSQVDNGNLLGMVSSCKASDGSTHDVADMWFAKGRAGAAAPSAAELLAGPAADLVGGAAAAPCDTIDLTRRR